MQTVSDGSNQTLIVAFSNHKMDLLYQSIFGPTFLQIKVQSDSAEEANTVLFTGMNVVSMNYE